MDRVKSMGLDIPTMVATSGAFDILTPGHMELFRTMRRLGSFTVVLLNTDESIRQYKSKHRPLKTWETRAKILDCNKFVDVIIGLPENTPENAIRELKPDVWVKGNRPISEIVEAGEVYANGGAVVSLWTNYVESTTNYIAEAYQIFKLESKENQEDKPDF
jgi:rfaE bifunctional protein nucleotidyltransferase chain/domain